MIGAFIAGAVFGALTTLFGMALGVAAKKGDDDK